MILRDWAARWGVPMVAVLELETGLGLDPPPCTEADHTEAWVQSTVRLEAARLGVWLTRNNVGALMDEHGRLVRYGLAHESKAQNVAVKSGDLIGIDSRPIQPEEVGKPRGRFVSVECKAPGWRWTGTQREQAQLAWATFVEAKGGDARFVAGPGQLS